MPRRSTLTPSSEQLPALPLRDTVHFPEMVHVVHVARERSRAAIRKALDGGGRVFTVSQRDMAVDEPRSTDLYRIGVISEVLQASPLPDGSLRVALRGIGKAEAVSFEDKRDLTYAHVAEIPELNKSTARIEALKRLCIDTFEQVVENHKQIPPEAIADLSNLSAALTACHTIAYHLPLEISKKQALLEEPDLAVRLSTLAKELKSELSVLDLQRKIESKVDATITTSQREFVLREQLHAIQMELGEGHEQARISIIRDRLRKAQPPEAVVAIIEREIGRLERLADSGAEFALCQTYIETLLELPWTKDMRNQVDFARAEAILGERHHGLAHVKQRVLEFLAVRKLTQKLRGPILCFVGPPGVGKTSVAASIADALDRKLVTISLAGMRDEAELRGHRRTYVGAMPGRIIQAVRQSGIPNPVILLDEIDKVGKDFRGDPSAVLLEALDPALNHSFVDHYVEAPYDLSEVIFIATANTTAYLHSALVDRMEVVEFPSYSELEKEQIVVNHILPKAKLEHGIEGDSLQFSPGVVQQLVRKYGVDPGIRQLSKRIEEICRFAALSIAKNPKSSVVIGENDLESILGFPLEAHVVSERSVVGTCTGLAVSDYGGSCITIEAVALKSLSSAAELRLTGNLGEVMRESAQAALTVVRQLADEAGLLERLRQDIHIHIGDPSIPKDGPSAGLAVALALWSTVCQRPIRGGFAAMGELTLSGEVKSIGAVREKLMAAQRSHVKFVVLPKGNERDLLEVPSELLESFEIRLASSVQEAIEFALEFPSSRAAIEPRSALPKD